MERALNFIIKASIVLTVFALPLAFFPWVPEAFELPKQFLLVSLMGVGLAAWLVKMVVVEQKITFKRTPLDLPIIVLLLVSLLSAVFSADAFSSLFGSFGRFSDGLAGLFALAAFFFLTTNTIQKASSLVLPFLLSMGLLMTASYLAFFGLFQRDIFPALVKGIGFNAASSSVEGFSVLLSVFVVFLAALAVRAEIYQLPKAGHVLFLFSALGLLVIYDVAQAWAVLLVGLLFLVAGTLGERIASKKREGTERKLWLPLVLLFVTIVFFFSPVTIAEPLSQFEREPLLSQQLSWEIALRTVSENPKQALIGSGPGTFSIDVAQLRPQELNDSPYWQFRFNRAASFIPELLATTGFAGILSYLFLVVWFSLASWILFRKGRSLAFVATVVALLSSHLFYYQNTVLAFTFFLFLALSALSWDNKLKDFVFTTRKVREFDVIAKVLLAVSGLALVATGVLTTRVAAAEVQYGFGRQATPSQLSLQIERTLKASELNPWQAEYRIALSNLYLSRALRELRKEESGRDTEQAAADVTAAIAYSRGDEREKGAVELSPKRADAWEAMGQVYKNLQVPGAADWAVLAFKKAIALSPANPSPYMELGAVYVQEDRVEEAKEQFEKALVLKQDLVEPKLQLALLSFKEGFSELAIAQLQELLRQEPSHQEALFELGRIYYNTGQVEEAIARFQLIVKSSPNHSNALFALGAAFEQQGKVKEAKEQFEKVLRLNPQNQSVQERLRQLAQ